MQIILRRNSGAVAEEIVVVSPRPTCFHMKFSCRNPVQKLTRHTHARGAPGDDQVSASRRTVAEHEVITSPRMRIGNFNVAGIARSNFEPGVNINESTAISNYIATIDVVSVCDRVNVCVVALRGVRGKRLQAAAWMRSPHACRGTAAGRRRLQGRHLRHTTRRLWNAAARSLKAVVGL